MWRGILVEVPRLPPFLRLSILVGVLCYLTSLVLSGWMLVPWLLGLLTNFAIGEDSVDSHLLAFMFSLLLLGFAFTFLPNAYRSHEHSPDTRGFPFHSWQQQARTTALLGRYRSVPSCWLWLLWIPLPASSGWWVRWRRPSTC